MEAHRRRQELLPDARGLINFHLLPRLGTLAADEFNGERLRAFALDVLETPPKRGNQELQPRRSIADEDALRKRKGTVNTLIGRLRVALRMAWENGKIDNDRSWRVLRRLPNVVCPRILHLNRAECRALLKECRSDLQQLVLAALYTGCRATELLRIQACHVGRDGYGVYITPVKRYRPRFVFLPDEGMAFFLALAKDRRPDDFLLVRSDGSPWYSLHRHMFKAAVRAADLPGAFTFHGLRHTYASQLIQAGTPLPVVAEQLGHSNTDTVSRTYGHLSPQIRESEVRQRFTTVSHTFGKLAAQKRRAMARWRGSLHGSDWRTYATITDLRSRKATT
ncbi:MAG: site-specific integrase [Rhizomicrobium sp.]